MGTTIMANVKARSFRMTSLFEKSVLLESVHKRIKGGQKGMVL